MFKMTKNMAAIFVAIMLLAQIGIAQHNSVHFTDHGHYEYVHDDHNHDNHQDHKKNARETCQICLLAKSLSSGLVATHAEIPAPVLSVHRALKSRDQIAHNYQYGFYNPRAPPVFLI